MKLFLLIYVARCAAGLCWQLVEMNRAPHDASTGCEILLKIAMSLGFGSWAGYLLVNL